MMRWSAFARAKLAIASSSLMISTNLDPWPSRARRYNPRLRLRHEAGLQNRLPGAAYEHTPRDRPGTRFLQNRPGEWSQYLLSRSRACKRPGHSSASRRSNVVSNVSTDVRVVAQHQVPHDRPGLPGLRPFVLAEPERVQLHVRQSGSGDGGLRRRAETE